MVSLRYTRNLFLRSICIVYLFAFISFYIQIPGLYGDNGILPARSLLENSKHKTWSAKVHYQPTLVWLAPYLGLNTNYALDLLALLGSFLAFTGFVSQKMCTLPLFAALWSLYFSLYQVGQVFVNNNYDELLLEIGFITLLVAPMLPGRKKGITKGLPGDTVSFWLIRWSLFRYILTSGLAKFISGCPKWWSLSALSYHFQSMPLPSPLSWYAHQLPEWFLKLTSVYVNVCELALPFLFFVPIRSVRTAGFVFQIFLQICIVLTGNFNFANLLIVTMLLSLLDDQFFYGKKLSKDSWSLIHNAANVIIHGVLVYAVVVLFTLKINGSQIDSHIAFTKEQFNSILIQGLTLTIYFAFITLGLTIFKALASALYESNIPYPRIVTVLITIIYSGFVVLLFLGSTVPLASLHPASNSSVHPVVRTVYNRLHKLHAVNQYTLFPKMTGIDGRPEIIIEGGDSIEGPWQEYKFLYKPGNVNHSLPFVAPYSPRLDWQMYWAAYSTYDKEPWILSLAHRLLIGQTEVLSLLDTNHSPFAKRPPKYVRASLYKYKYTPWSQKQYAVWWQRERVGDYFPIVNKDSSFLQDFLKARNLLPYSQKQHVNLIWKQVLDSVRYITSHLEATLLLWSVFTAGCAIITTTGKKVRRYQEEN